MSAEPDSNAPEALRRRDRLDAKTKQLAALTLTFYGESDFHNHSEELQDVLLWLAADLADEVQKLVAQL
jgi:hypothetical protein